MIQQICMGVEQNIAAWQHWNQKIGSKETYLRSVLDEDPSWYRAFGQEVRLNPDRVYDSRAMDWNIRVTNGVIDALCTQGIEFREVFFPIAEGYRQGAVRGVFAGNPSGFVVADPGPKSVEDLKDKLKTEGVKGYKHIFDFLRLTLVGSDMNVCQQMQEALLYSVNSYGLFAPLREEERTLKNGRVAPEISEFGNQFSPPELLEMVRSKTGFARTIRFQIGPEAIGKEYFRYDSDLPGIVHFHPPAGLGVSVVIMTADIFEYLQDPNSPAHHSNYENRRKEVRKWGLCQ